jgi:peptide/nickel transport system substrate-binding protein
MHRANPPSSRRRWAVVIAVIVMGAAACGGSSTSAPEPSEETVVPVSGGALVVGTSSDVDGFNPLSSQWSGPGHQMARTVLDPLTVIDDQGNWQPYLAEAFTPNGDFTVWTITLRPGVTFHNGEALDADALITYLDAMSASPLASNALPETPVIAEVDDLNVSLTFTEPWSGMPIVFADQPGYVIAPEQIESGEADRPIGTGPFVFQEWVPDRFFKAVRNDAYWRDGLPYLDSIEFRPMPDPTTRFNALRTGAIDVAEANSTGQARLDELARDGLTIVDGADATGTHLLVMNLDRAPTDDIRIREAVVRAIDREAFRATAYDESFAIASQPYAPGSRWFRDNGYPEYDPERARELVDDYEAENGPVTLSIMAISAGDRLQPVVYMQEVLESVGIDVEVNGIEQVTFVTDLVSGNYESVYLGGFFGTPDPDGLHHFIHSDNAAPEAPIKLNFPRHRSAVVDDALRAQRDTDDDDARAEAWAEVWRAFATDLPYAFLLHERAAFATAADVHGFTGFTAPDGTPLAPMNRWTPFYTGVFTTPG